MQFSAPNTIAIAKAVASGRFRNRALHECVLLLWLEAQYVEHGMFGEDLKGLV